MAIGLGTIVVGIAAIAAIVNSAKSIISDTEEILQDVKSIMKELDESSEGSFANTLKEAGARLQKVFSKLIKAFTQIFDNIFKAIERMEAADNEGAGNLRSAII